MNTNDNGTLKATRVQAVNDGGVIRFHRSITENSSGVLREIFAAYPEPISGSYSFLGGGNKIPEITEIGTVTLYTAASVTFTISNPTFPQGGNEKVAQLLIDGNLILNVNYSAGENFSTTTTMNPGTYTFSARGFGVTGGSSGATFYPASFDYEITFGGAT